MASLNFMNFPSLKKSTCLTFKIRKKEVFKKRDVKENYPSTDTCGAAHRSIFLPTVVKFTALLTSLLYVCNYTNQLTHIFGLINFISSLPHNFIVVDHKAANRNFNIFQGLFGLKDKNGKI